MTLTIETNGVRHVWRTGDPVDDLAHAVTLLGQYVEELRQPSVHAQLAQLPIPTSNGSTPISQ